MGTMSIAEHDALITFRALSVAVIIFAIVAVVAVIINFAALAITASIGTVLVGAGIVHVYGIDYIRHGWR